MHFSYSITDEFQIKEDNDNGIWERVTAEADFSFSLESYGEDRDGNRGVNYYELNSVQNFRIYNEKMEDITNEVEDEFLKEISQELEKAATESLGE